MFKDSRVDRIEEALLKHMEKEEKSFEKLIHTLDSIKNEINETNRQMREYHSDNEIRLIELKTEITSDMSEKYITRKAFDSNNQSINKTLIKLSENKLDKSYFKIIVSTITAIAFIISWIINTYSKVQL
jgi:fructose-1,6-bisphosphatase